MTRKSDGFGGLGAFNSFWRGSRLLFCFGELGLARRGRRCWAWLVFVGACFDVPQLLSPLSLGWGSRASLAGLVVLASWADLTALGVAEAPSVVVSACPSMHWHHTAPGSCAFLSVVPDALLGGGVRRGPFGGHCGARCWVWSLDQARSRAVPPVGWGVVAGRLGVSGVVTPRWAGYGPRRLAVRCGQQAGVVRGLESGLPGSAACGGRECRWHMTRRWPRKG